MQLNKHDLKKRNHAENENWNTVYSNKLLQYLRIGGNITNYQGYGQQNVSGCICCGQNTTKGKKKRKTASFERVNRQYKRREQRLANNEIETYYLGE